MFDTTGGIPKGLAEMAPSPYLAAVLSAVEVGSLSGADVVTVLKAQSRLLSHLQAQLMTSMVEVSHRVDAEWGSCPEAGEFAADEIRAALTLTRRSADSQLALATELRERLPRVWEALHRGDIDLARARTLCQATRHLDDDNAGTVVDQIIEQAPGLTTGQINAGVQKLCIAVDPHQAEARYRRGLEDRRVVAEANPDGTANLYGFGLPPHRVAAIRKRISDAAYSLKTRDETRTIDQIRADIFLDLLEGGNHTAGRGAIIDIGVDLTTLARLDDNPGQIPGWGPVIADIARQVTHDQPDASWQVTVTHPDNGHPMWAGVTRRRPDTTQTRHVTSRNPTCVFPGCRMPAADCDLDHTQAWANGGPTTPDNLAPLCRHDHRLKHHAGSNLQTTNPGQYTWTTPLGHGYVTSGRAPP